MVVIIQWRLATSVIWRHLSRNRRSHGCNNTVETGDFCQLETFEPECWKNEVIVIEKAIYGRHRVGKCIKAEEAAISQDKRFFGCSTDVIGLLDAKCSGRKRCQVRIPDADLERTEPCLSILKMFLEVSYRCVEGKTSTTYTCELWVLSENCRPGNCRLFSIKPDLLHSIVYIK